MFNELFSGGHQKDIPKYSSGPAQYLNIYHVTISQHKQFHSEVNVTRTLTLHQRDFSLPIPY